MGNDCGTLLASASLPLTVALFLAALSGSLTHCAVLGAVTALIAMSSSSLVVVLNSLRLKGLR